MLDDLFKIHPSAGAKTSVKKMKILVLLLVIFVCCYHQTRASNTPYNTSAYQQKMGTGFSTNYFKTLNFNKYRKQNIEDILQKGFKNVRLRCRADLDGFDMTTFLNNLETVVDDCLEKDVVPIISWIHHEAEAFANETHRQGYLQWWTEVATRLKDKDYRLSFNLFTELGVDGCGDSCEQSLRENRNKYHNWTIEVVQRIRESGGKNDKRIIILASPTKTAKGLDEIDSSVYKNDDYMMVEWHFYASGPNKKPGGAKFWEGDGTGEGKNNVDAAFQYATDFTTSTGVLTYLGAWMPQDNSSGALNQTEVIYFARYFIEQLYPIPWSLNVLDVYYKTKTSQWLTGIQTIKNQPLNMSEVLDNIIQVRNLLYSK